MVIGIDGEKCIYTYKGVIIKYMFNFDFYQGINSMGNEYPSKLKGGQQQ